jgi:hypothetical protein
MSSGKDVALTSPINEWSQSEIDSPPILFDTINQCFQISPVLMPPGDTYEAIGHYVRPLARRLWLAVISAISDESLDKPPNLHRWPRIRDSREFDLDLAMKRKIVISKGCGVGTWILNQAQKELRDNLRFQSTRTFRNKSWFIGEFQFSQQRIEWSFVSTGFHNNFGSITLLLQTKSANFLNNHRNTREWRQKTVQNLNCNTHKENMMTSPRRSRRKNRRKIDVKDEKRCTEPTGILRVSCQLFVWLAKRYPGVHKIAGLLLIASLSKFPTPRTFSFFSGSLRWMRSSQ